MFKILDDGISSAASIILFRFGAARSEIFDCRVTLKEWMVIKRKEDEGDNFRKRKFSERLIPGLHTLGQCFHVVWHQELLGSSCPSTWSPHRPRQAPGSCSGRTRAHRTRPASRSPSPSRPSCGSCRRSAPPRPSPLQCRRWHWTSFHLHHLLSIAMSTFQVGKRN